MSTPPPPPPPPPISGYVHNVSALTEGRSPRTKFFKFDIQLANDVKKVICFSPEKRKLMSTHEGKSCKISKYEVSKHPMSDIVFKDKSEVIDETVDFERTNIETKLSQISDLQKITNNQEVYVEIKVTSKQKSETITRGTKEMIKSECMATDNTGSIRLVAWEPHSLKLGHSYHLKVRVKSFEGDKYINTTAETTFEEIEPLDISDEPTQDVNKYCIKGNIASMEIVSRHLKCTNCRKKLVNTASKVTKCQNCHMSQLTKKCHQDLTVKLHIDPIGQNQQRMFITCFSDTIATLITSDPFTLSDDELTEKILEMGEHDVTFIINPTTRICSNIQPFELTYLSS
ncbi:uncharacterized protein LOC118415351 [Branchiostoma floridae]|uniref:Uncharacterized protein LOC118415351 n=1 Tax=Branchiostoma floridae TaxID=7739 RepID=A0A9J7L489_BRAFL|nr:uncharacterized protein LOC118415351 [Branchiostoma floridae]